MKSNKGIIPNSFFYVRGRKRMRENMNNEQKIGWKNKK